MEPLLRPWGAPMMLLLDAELAGRSARMGLVSAHAQLRWVRELPLGLLDPLLLPPPSGAESQYEDDGGGAAALTPPKNPAHMIRWSRSSSSPTPSWPSGSCLAVCLGSRWDSTRRSAQSPNPTVERRSRKSPEKLRLPQPTERDRATFRPNDDEPSLRRPGLSGSAMASSRPPSDADTEFRLAAAAPPPPLAVVEDALLRLLNEEEDRWKKDQKLFFRGLSAVIADGAGANGSSGRGATDLLRLSPPATGTTDEDELFVFCNGIIIF
jgi:hypothetical protein